MLLGPITNTALGFLYDSRLEQALNTYCSHHRADDLIVKGKPRHRDFSGLERRYHIKLGSSSALHCRCYMKKRRAEGALEALERELLARICSARSDYQQQQVANDGGSKQEPLHPAQNGISEQHTGEERGDENKGKFSRPRLADVLLGPNLTGLHVLAGSSLVRLLALEAVAEARGSCQELVPVSTSGNDDGVKASRWSVGSAWEPPKVWLRQGKTPVEADSSSLGHWVQAQLSPESRAVSATLVVIHPVRSEASTDVDDIFISEFQSAFDMCGYGSIPLKPSGKLSYQVDRGPSSLEQTARNLGMAVHNWATLSRLHSGTMHSAADEPSPPIGILVVWPSEGWAYSSRMALAAIAESLPRGSTSAVQMVPEDVVLISRRRRSRIVGLATGLYSMLVHGSAVLLPSERPQSTLAKSTIKEASPDAMNGGRAAEDNPTTSAAVVVQVNNKQSNHIHVALTASADGRWLVVSWCTPLGDRLSVRAVRMPTTGGDDRPFKGMTVSHMEHCIDLVHQETSNKFSALTIIVHGVADPQLLPSSIQSVLLKKSPVCICLTSDPESTFVSSPREMGSSDSYFHREDVLNELDDLAFLSSSLEKPVHSMQSAVLLGALNASGATAACDGGWSTTRHFQLPLHLKAATRMAGFLNGLVPDVDDDGVIQSRYEHTVEGS